MHYELWKELKDAGFPQKSGRYISETGRHGGWSSDKGIEEFDDKIGGYEHWAYIPTLEELIEACGEDFQRVENTKPMHDRWRAYSWDQAYGDIDDFHYGESPAEAIARLWLHLNKKV